MRYLLLICLALCFGPALAGTGFGGKITRLVNHESGVVVITFEGTPSEDGCKYPSSVVLQKDNPLFKEIYAMALTAASQDKSIFGWTLGQCATIYGETYPRLVRLDWVK